MERSAAHVTAAVAGLVAGAALARTYARRHDRRVTTPPRTRYAADAADVTWTLSDIAGVRGVITTGTAPLTMPVMLTPEDVIRTWRQLGAMPPWD